MAKLSTRGERTRECKGEGKGNWQAGRRGIEGNRRGGHEIANLRQHSVTVSTRALCAGHTGGKLTVQLTFWMTSLAGGSRGIRGS